MTKQMVFSILGGAIFALAVIWLDANVVGAFLGFMIIALLVNAYAIIWAVKSKPEKVIEKAGKITLIACFVISFLIVGTTFFVIFQ